MKVHVTNYVFSPATKQITFPGYTSISLDNILVISNATNGTIIYNFADPNLVGTVNNNVLTLNYNTTSMSSTDKLVVYFDDADKMATDATLAALLEQNALMRRMLKIFEIQQNTDSIGRQKIFVESIADGAGRVAALVRDANNNNVYGVAPWPMVMYDTSRIAVECQRNKLTF